MSLTISSAEFTVTQKPTTTSKPQNNINTSSKETNDAPVTLNTTPKENLAKLKKEGCYRGEAKFFFGLITREAEYTYYADGKESIAEIKAKFALKDGAIIKCNKNVVSTDWIPPKNYEIFFLEEDADYQK